MKRGFYTIMAAQFFSSLADNALFVAAVELIRSSGGAEWQRAALVPMFALFYVILAPFVGAFADSKPKGTVMMVSNSIKLLGCLLMLVGQHPLLAYALVGLGAAAYSPAKYGILTELLPASQLVKANGWIEGLTIASIILGVLLGGTLMRSSVADFFLGFDFPLIDTGIDTPPEAAIAIMVFVYALAAWINTRIPHTGVEMVPLRRDPSQSLWVNLVSLLPDFRDCNRRLWRDKLGQISLATTTLFWGVSGNLRYIVLAWSALALGYTTSQASSLVGVVAIGTAAGAVLASLKTRLDDAPRFILMGAGMGVQRLGRDGGALHQFDIDARQLAGMGVVNYAVPADQLDAKTNEIAQRLLKRNAYALALTKRVLNKQMLANFKPGPVVLPVQTFAGVQIFHDRIVVGISQRQQRIGTWCLCQVSQSIIDPKSIDVDITCIADIAIELRTHAVYICKRLEQARSWIFLKEGRRVHFDGDGTIHFRNLF